MAPGPPGRVLVDATGSGVAVALDFAAARFASLTRGQPGDEARAVLRDFDGALAFTAQASLLEGLRAAGLEVAAQSPTPMAMHAADWFAEPTRSFAAEVSAAVPPPLKPTRDEDAAATDLQQGLGLAPGFLALHPGSGNPAKNWLPARFAEVAAQGAPGERWLLVEGPADAMAVGPLADAPGAVRVRGLPLRTLGALLARSGVYVGNDSGVTHLAAAYDAPTVALFGPSDPAIYSPVGGCVRIVRSPSATMPGLDVEPVTAAVRALRSAVGEPRVG
jgi:heptosyltransferase-2